MKIKKTLIMCVLGILFTNTWAASSASNNEIYTNSMGKECRLISKITITSEMEDLITNTLNALWSIPNLTGTKCSVIVEADNYYYFTIYPESLLFNDVDLSLYSNTILPSIRFVYANQRFCMY